MARGSSDREVVVTLAEPFNEWQSLFTLLYPRSTNASPDEFNFGWINRIPVTAGPFQVEKFDAKGKTITLARSPQWWGNPASSTGSSSGTSKPTTMLRAITKGEIDVFDIGPSPETTPVREVWDAVVRQAAGPEYRQLTFNGESEVLSDLRVRQAIALAIDRKAIMEIDLKGLGWPIVTLDHHFLMNSQYVGATPAPTAPTTPSAPPGCSTRPAGSCPGR